MTLTLFDVPTDPTTSIALNASAIIQAMATPGQNATWTFAGASSQQVTVKITSNTAALITASLVNAAGTVLRSGSGSGSFNLAPYTLVASGTYTVKIDPSEANTGSVGVQVTNP